MASNFVTNIRKGEAVFVIQLKAPDDQGKARYQYHAKERGPSLLEDIDDAIAALNHMRGEVQEGQQEANAKLYRRALGDDTPFSQMEI